MIVMLPPQLGARAGEEPDSKSYVLRACRVMLRPIIRMLLKSGIVHRDMLKVTREVYVDVARREFGLGGRPTSISRTALLTGLARKEVRRIADQIEAGGGAVFEPGNQDRIARVLSGWFQDTDYLDDDGLPRPLPADGLPPSFASLKARYGGDVPASAILRELLNCGTVQKNDDGLLQPVYRNYRPNPAKPEHLLRAGSVLEDVGTTVMRNLFRGENGARWLERRASNTSMPEHVQDEFREMLAREGQEFLEKVDAWMTEHELTDDGEKTIRLGVGMYIIRDDDQTPQD
ncbi:MAG: hypothetical protein HKO55_07645 [Gammaproteobacteria bacterium]|nr:hypothetical protein [Gammaproteobacteria bacterium]NNM21126.1 hypothetical protein [Gammaproteobacteria bacterium]